MPEDKSTTPGLTEARFDKTHWSVVLPAAEHRSPGAQQALEQLCKTYWPPLYAFLRWQGSSPEDAKDLIQGFFVHLLAGNRLEQVHPQKGKFRSFLLACLKNYTRNERDKQQAKKRGGGQMVVAINLSEAETNCGSQPSDADDPLKIFERKWAAALIDRVLEQLKQAYTACGKPGFFEALHPFLVGDAQRGDYGPVASRLQMSEGAVRAAATRMRNDFRELLRAEVGRTVSSPAEIDEELRYLFAAFR